MNEHGVLADCVILPQCLLEARIREDIHKAGGRGDHLPFVSTQF
jgi:hypothetical protein